jgi:uracil-DNA glycosylase family 4
LIELDHPIKSALYLRIVSPSPAARPDMTTWNGLNRKIIGCELCPRLRAYCQRVAREKRRAYLDWTYWGKPVPNFGDPSARVLVVGLAPAAHGGNRTGRMFTGDRSGQWLYRALFQVGFANHPGGLTADDGLQLIGCAVTAICHCAPPDNKPSNDEIANCRRWLSQTIDLVPARVFVALGQIAWKGLLDELIKRGWWTERRPPFGHRAMHQLDGDRWLLGSYHPSQQNTFTGRLTEAMLHDVFRTAHKLVKTG